MARSNVRRKQIEIDFIQHFHKEKHSAHSIVKEIDSFLGTDNLAVRALPFGCGKEWVNWAACELDWRRTVQLLYRVDRLWAYKLDHHQIDSSDEPHCETGYFFIIQNETHPNVGVAIILSNSDFFRRAFLPVVHRLHPLVMMTFVSHKRMRQLIEGFEERGGYDKLVITRATQRLRRDESLPGQRAIPMVSWPKMSVSGAMEWIESQNGWFETLEFEVINNGLYQGQISLTRHGVVKATSLFVDAYETFVLPICETIHENIELFKGRGRLEREDLSVMPLQVKFNEDQFIDVEENGKFIEAMYQMKTASVSVLHGNPYIHISVLDYMDASAFDLWVLDDSRLIIVPQLRATIVAIKRIINHIFDFYAEGRLSTYTAEEINE